MFKKKLIIYLIVIIIFLLFINSKKKHIKEISIQDKKVLLAVKLDGSNILSCDQIIIDHLKTLGLQVKTKDADDIDPEDDKYFDLIFIAESVNSTKVGDKFNYSKKPFMSCEHFIADDMGFTGLESNKNFGQTESVYKEINIVDSSHLTAADFTGKVVVYKENGKFGFSKPEGQVNIIATLPDDESKALIYAYEKNKKNREGQRVPARRLFFYLYQDQEANQTEDSWKLFDACLKWTIGAYK